MRTTTQFGSLLIGAALSLAATSARAQLLAYEGFDYAVGNLTGLNGGSGWSTPWQLNGGSATANSQIFSGSYGYTVGGYSLVTTGNRGYFTGDGSATGDNIGGTAASAQPLRQMSVIRGHDATNGAYSTWISFIALRTGAPTPVPGAAPANYLYGRAAGVQFFHQANTSLTAQGNEQFTVGRGTQSSETDTSLMNDTWGVLQQGNANAIKVTSLNFASAPADFILMRIDHVGTAATTVGNADTLRVWINPGSLTGAPTDGSADLTFLSSDFSGLGVNRDWVFDRIRLFGGNPQGTSGTTYSYGAMGVDEIRIGGDFGSVTPYIAVPEPAAAAIAGVGLLGFLLRRKRD